MDRNLLVAIGLSLAVWVLWVSLVPPLEPVDGTRTPLDIPAGDEAPRPALAPRLPAASPAATRVEPPAPPLELSHGDEQRFEVQRPLYRAELTTKGAALAHWELAEYLDVPSRGAAPIVLTTGEPPWDTALLTPFEGLGLGDLTQAHFELVAADADRAEFALHHADVSVSKVYEFDDAYGVRLLLRVENESERPVTPRFSVLWPAHVQEAPDFREQSMVALRAGAVEMAPLAGLGRPGFLGFSQAQPVIEHPGEVDWAGSQTTYFLSVVAAGRPADASARFIALEPGVAGLSEISLSPIEIPPGRSAEREFRAYLGPKEEQQLLAFGSETVRSIDLGWSWVAPLTRFFGWLLHALYSIIPNYGVAIIVLTILVRVVTIPLTTKQMRSMERMRALSPKIKEIQEKYADDRQKLSEQTMALYRREKVNPLGGCLPMVLQLPVFIGLFYALRSSIHLRQAPFVAWIDDLSAPETLLTIPGLEIPIRVLPLVMGATMVLQQKLTPMPSMDPTQARLMTTFMPIMMTVVFYQFPSGLVLYWMVSNVLAIAHQRWVGRGMNPAGSSA